MSPAAFLSQSRSIEESRGVSKSLSTQMTASVVISGADISAGLEAAQADFSCVIRLYNLAFDLKVTLVEPPD
jgi:hypothetical protein